MLKYCLFGLVDTKNDPSTWRWPWLWLCPWPFPGRLQSFPLSMRVLSIESNTWVLVDFLRGALKNRNTQELIRKLANHGWQQSHSSCNIIIDLFRNIINNKLKISIANNRSRPTLHISRDNTQF
jgi:hypothetical protein